MLAKTYTDESGENIIPKALPGLNDAEIETFRNLLPSRRLPPDIEELIRFAAGVDFGGYPTIVLFTTYMSETDLSFLYTHYIDLMGDGSGNFWTLDIYPDGTGARYIIIATKQALSSGIQITLPSFCNM